MELGAFALEFFSHLSNFVPVALLVILGCMVLLLASTRWGNASALSRSLIAGAVAASILLAVGLIIWRNELPSILPEPLFWVGAGLTIATAWPLLWFFALLLNRRHKRQSELQSAEAFK